ncbi:MAG: dihydropteroate synthase, partial [candidate division KSB1 bacterium]|nr:dihydropteroate synthase [candidate division KSB1 bacterium]
AGRPAAGGRGRSPAAAGGPRAGRGCGAAAKAAEAAGRASTRPPNFIQKAAKHLDNRRPWMINSIKKEQNIMNELLPLAAEYNVPVVALAMDKDGIPPSSKERINVCTQITEQADKHGVDASKLFFDPLVMPISSDYKGATVTFDTLSGIKKQIPHAKTTMGLSNVSFGLVERKHVNQAFLIAALSHGLDSAICDPTRQSVRDAIPIWVI